MASAASRRCAATRGRGPRRPAASGPRTRRRWREELRERLRDSVRAHLVADVPVGVLLSGGVDSSALAALAARESSDRVSTFSIGFEERAFNELDHARLVAERYGTDHHELVVRPDAVELLPQLARGVRRAVRRLVGDADVPGLRARRRHVKVALSGEGGDELFGGYNTYVADTLAPRIGPRRVGAAAAGRARCRAPPAKVSFDYKAKRFARAAHLPPLERHHAWKEIFSPEARAELLDGRRGARRPARRLPRPLRRDRRRGGARAAAGRRHRDLPGRRHAREDRPREHGALARGAGAVLRPGGRRARARAAAPDEGARPREEAAPAPGGLDAAAARDRARAASGASRSRPRPGCAASCSRSRATCCRRDACARRASSTRRPSPRLLDDHVARREDISRQLWGLLMFSLWHERYGVGRRSPPRRTAARRTANCERRH